MPDIVTRTDPPSVGQTTARDLGINSDEPARDGVRLGLVVSITLAVLLGIYLLGVVGHKAGFAASVGVHNLTQAPGAAFVDGLLIPVALLNAIYTTGVRDPLLFTGALVVLLPPIGALVVARPRQRGQALPRQQVRIAAGIGAALILFADILIAIRAASATGTILLQPEFLSQQEFLDFFTSMESMAAVDSVAMVVSILLAVLVFRLPIDRWVRGTVGTCAIATCVITSASTAASGGTVSGLQQQRSVYRGSTGPSVEIVLGVTDAGEYAVMFENGIVGLRAPETAKLVGHASILEFLNQGQTP